MITTIVNPTHQTREHPMAWNTPKIVEICVGLEINSYACAEV
jgi:coenzyme PQQ precursor peptide PqqA